MVVWVLLRPLLFAPVWPMTAPPPSRRSVSPLVFIVLTVVIEVTGTGLLFPIIPYLIQEFRSDAFTVGLLSSSFAMAQFLAAPVLGGLSDRVGRRPVLLMCALGTAISFFVFGFAQSLWVMFAAQIINGMTGGVVSTAQAYIADVSSSPEARTKNFGLLGAAAGIGFILGPVLGGTLAGINLRLPVFVAGGVALVNVLVGYFTVKESLKTPSSTPISLRTFNPVAQLLDLLRRPVLRYLLAAYFLFYISFAGLTSTFVVFARDSFTWGPAQAAGVLFWVGIVSTVVQGGLIRRLLPRYGSQRLLVAGMITMTVALVLICLVPAGGYLYLTQGLYALGVGLVSPTLRGAVANAVPDSEQGQVSGGSQALTSLTQILGPLVAGGVYDQVGATASFAQQAVCMVLAICCLVVSRGVGTPSAQAS